MALVIEDGTLVANANSFATRAEIIAYAAERGVTIPNDETADQKAIAAMDFLWAQPLLGSLVDDEQTTPFPRMGLVDGDEDVEAWEYTIPPGVKRAQMQLALDAHNGVTLTASGPAEAAVKMKKAGPVEKEFFEAPDPSGNARVTVALAFLAPFLTGGGGFGLEVVRA